MTRRSSPLSKGASLLCLAAAISTATGACAQPAPSTR